MTRLGLQLKTGALAALLAAAPLVACLPGPATQDASVPDGGAEDGGTADAGELRDAGLDGGQSTCPPRSGTFPCTGFCAVSVEEYCAGPAPFAVTGFGWSVDVCAPLQAWTCEPRVSGYVWRRVEEGCGLVRFTYWDDVSEWGTIFALDGGAMVHGWNNGVLSASCQDPGYVGPRPDCAQWTNACP